MARPITVISIKRQTINNMKKLGTYSPEYDPLIEIYSGLLFSYQKYWQQFKENDFVATEEYENKKGVILERKSPLIQSMESLRKDIIVYSDRLNLNPKSNSVEAKQRGEPDGFEAILGQLLS